MIGAAPLVSKYDSAAYAVFATHIVKVAWYEFEQIASTMQIASMGITQGTAPRNSARRDLEQFASLQIPAADVTQRTPARLEQYAAQIAHSAWREFEQVASPMQIAASGITQGNAPQLGENAALIVNAARREFVKPTQIATAGSTQGNAPRNAARREFEQFLSRMQVTQRTGPRVGGNAALIVNAARREFVKPTQIATAGSAQGTAPRNAARREFKQFLSRMQVAQRTGPRVGGNAAHIVKASWREFEHVAAADSSQRTAPRLVENTAHIVNSARRGFEQFVSRMQIATAGITQGTAPPSAARRESERLAIPLEVTNSAAAFSGEAVRTVSSRPHRVGAAPRVEPALQPGAIQRGCLSGMPTSGGMRLRGGGATASAAPQLVSARKGAGR